jgi:hypothetical protein
VRSKWRVTDFVTLGSPLAHADILLARDRVGLEAKQNDREFPTCLPVLEKVIFFYKCGYCESYFGATQPVAIEHYRSKARERKGRRSCVGITG